MKGSTLALPIFIALLSAGAHADPLLRQPLFSEDKAIAVTLSADFSGDELRPNDVDIQEVLYGNDEFKSVPAKLTVSRSDGEKIDLDVQIKVRGKDRALNCAFPPLKLSFSKTGGQTQEQTEFKGLRGLKIVTHCDRMEPIVEHGDDGFRAGPFAVQQEYLAYKTYQVVTEKSLGARFASITYIDTSKKKKPFTRSAILIEDQKDLAKRVGMRLAKSKDEDSEKELRKIPFDRYQVTQIDLFQTLLGNWDYDSDKNMIALVTGDQKRIMVPYDFDRSFSFETSKFTWRLSPLSSYINPSVAGLTCLSEPQRVELLAQFQRVSAHLIEAVKNEKQISASEKKKMTSYYSGFGKWLKTLPGAAKNVECMR